MQINAINQTKYPDLLQKAADFILPRDHDFSCLLVRIMANALIDKQTILEISTKHFPNKNPKELLYTVDSLLKNRTPYSPDLSSAKLMNMAKEDGFIPSAGTEKTVKRVTEAYVHVPKRPVSISFDELISQFSKCNEVLTGNVLLEEKLGLYAPDIIPGLRQDQQGGLHALKYSCDGKVRGITKRHNRSTDNKENRNCSPSIVSSFGLIGCTFKELESKERVVAVEGVIDAITAIELGYQPIILTSKNNAKATISEFKTAFPSIEVLYFVDWKEGQSLYEQETVKDALALNIPFAIPEFRGRMFKDFNEGLMKNDIYELKRAYERLIYPLNKPNKAIPIPEGWPSNTKMEVVKREKYINIDYSKYSGILAVMSFMGSGKTFPLKQFVDSLPEGTRVYIITHRRALAFYYATLLDAEYYEDICNHNLNTSQRVSTTIQSVHRLTNIHPDSIVIFDESEQGMHETITSSTMSKMRIKTINTLIEMINKSKLTILMDAHMSSMTGEVLSKFDKPITHYVNTYQPRKGMVNWLIEEEKAIFAHAIASINSGKQISFSSNRVDKLKSLYENLTYSQKQKTILIAGKDGDCIAPILIDPSRNGLKERLLSFAKSEAVKGFNILFSPAMQTGISVPENNHSCSVRYGLYYPWLNDQFGITQSLFRVRGNHLPLYLSLQSHGATRFIDTHKARVKREKEQLLLELRADIEGDEQARKILGSIDQDVTASQHAISANFESTVCRLLEQDGSETRILETEETDILINYTRKTSKIPLKKVKEAMESIERDSSFNLDSRYPSPFFDEQKCINWFKQRVYCLINADESTIIDIAARDYKTGLVNELYELTISIRDVKETYLKEIAKVAKYKDYTLYQKEGLKAHVLKHLLKHIGFNQDFTFREGCTFQTSKSQRDSIQIFMRRHKEDIKNTLSKSEYEAFYKDPDSMVKKYLRMICPDILIKWKSRGYVYDPDKHASYCSILRSIIDSFETNENYLKRVQKVLD